MGIIILCTPETEQCPDMKCKLYIRIMIDPHPPLGPATTPLFYNKFELRTQLHTYACTIKCIILLQYVYTYIIIL